MRRQRELPSLVYRKFGGCKLRTAVFYLGFGRVWHRAEDGPVPDGSVQRQPLVADSADPIPRRRVPVRGYRLTILVPDLRQGFK